MEKIDVSIICTNYNKGQWIEEALESFLQQETALTTEIIVVDDASSDQSVSIIKDYHRLYPDKVNPVYHQKNQGITRTWKSICQVARGRYIARCDGDDYWTDPLKLDKQVSLLENTPSSAWCNSDFDMVDSQGNLIYADVFKNEILPLSKTYEEMLALKTMTMASTWLVEADLMREVTQELDDTAIDDTYNLQLELFRRTELTTLQESTTIYRMNQGSDSKPVTQEQVAKRFDGLLRTQLAYVKKYPDADYKKVSQLLFKKDKESDLRHFDKDTLLQEQRQQFSQITSAYQKLQDDYQHLAIALEETKQAKEDWQERYQMVTNSRRWQYASTILNVFRRKK